MSKLSGRFILTAVVGALLLILPMISLLVDPIRVLILYNTRVARNSFMFNLFQKEVEGAHLSLYVFNVTNAEAFISGDDYQLRVEEVGPFTYAEIRQNVDIELDEEAGVLEFTPKMRLRFVPEASVARPEDVSVTVPNLALLSATSLLRSYPFFIQDGYNLLVSHLKSKAISTYDVHSYLWGYEDPLISLANKLVPGLIYFDRFGIVDRLYENKTMYRMKVGTQNHERFGIRTLKKYMRTEDWRGHQPLESYKFNDTYEGVAFPPYLSSDTTLNIYRLGVCKELDLEFYKPQMMSYGAEAWLYRISNRTFNKDCVKGVCGMLDLSSCTYGTPIAMSRTHFLDTDPKLYKRIIGINPDPKKHDSFFLIEPTVGISLATSLSLQMNINLGKLDFNSETKPFTDMVLPIAYIKVVQQKVFEDIDSILRIVYVTAPNILLALEILSFLIGASLFTYAGLLLYRRNNFAPNRKPCGTPLAKHHVPLLQVKT